jgi:hypothetical protein
MSRAEKRQMIDIGFTTKDYAKGARVQAHPATDTWMRGDRYGTVVSVGKRLIHVRMDRSNRVVKFTPDNLLPSDH